jgi:hypothetical protein
MNLKNLGNTPRTQRSLSRIKNTKLKIELISQYQEEISFIIIIVNEKSTLD